MTLEPKIPALIAVGASVSANYPPCLERNLDTAAKCGADPRQIAEAIEIGKKVRHGAAGKMDAFITSRYFAPDSATGAAEDSCGCHS